MQIDTDTADKIAARIITKGTTVGELAKRSLIPKTTLRRKLTGQGSFTINEMFRISQELNVKMSDLLPEYVSHESKSAA